MEGSLTEKRMSSAVGWSLLIHVLTLLVILGSVEWQRQSFDDPYIEIQLVPIKKKFNRIVRTEKGELSKEAAPDSFLGKETRRVKEQTVAKGGDNLFDSQPKQKAQDFPLKGTKKTLGSLGVAMIQPNRLRPRDKPQFVQMGEKLNTRSQEYIKGLKEGQTTALNTKEYIYFSYFERIRKRLNQAWKPILRNKIVKIYRKGRFLASGNDYLTKTVVTLNREGSVVRVRVIEESGTRDLDEAAVNAFNKAGPFPNPPKGLVDESGMVDIRWDFILKT